MCVAWIFGFSNNRLCVGVDCWLEYYHDVHSAMSNIRIWYRKYTQISSIFLEGTNCLWSSFSELAFLVSHTRITHYKYVMLYSIFLILYLIRRVNVYNCVSFYPNKLWRITSAQHNIYNNRYAVWLSGSVYCKYVYYVCVCCIYSILAAGCSFVSLRSSLWFVSEARVCFAFEREIGASNQTSDRIRV